MVWGLESCRTHSPESEVDPQQLGKNELHGFARVVRTAGTFVFVMFAWVFFRANNLTEALYFFGHLFDGITNIKAYFILNGTKSFHIGGLLTAVRIAGSIIFLAIWDCISVKRDVISMITSQKYFLFRYAFYFGILTVLILYRAAGNTQFVYFQF